MIGLVIYFALQRASTPSRRAKLSTKAWRQDMSVSDARSDDPDPVIAEDDQLHRALGPVHLTLIGIGAIIGAGIFVIAGTAAAEHAGPGGAGLLPDRGAGLFLRRRSAMPSSPR